MFRLIRLFKKNRYFDVRIKKYTREYIFFTNSRYENYQLYSHTKNLKYIYYSYSSYSTNHFAYEYNKFIFLDRKRRRVWFDINKNLSDQICNYYTKGRIHHYVLIQILEKDLQVFIKDLEGILNQLELWIVNKDRNLSKNDISIITDLYEFFKN